MIEVSIVLLKPHGLRFEVRDFFLFCVNLSKTDELFGFNCYLCRMIFVTLQNQWIAKK